MFSSYVDYSHRSTVFRAVRMPSGTDDLVGASLLAKTVFQSMHFRRLCKLFREQARSHRYGVFSGDVKHSHRAGVFSSYVDYSHRSAVSRAMRMPCGTDDLVGASLLAKTVFQSMHFRRLCKLFREQARSHRYGVFSGDVKHSHRSGVLSSHVDYSHSSAVSRAMRMPCGTDDLVGASLLAKTVFQSMHFRRLCKLFREQARSHRYGVFSGDVKHSHRAGVFSSYVDYSHRSAVSRAMRMPCGTDDLVGASLLAKTVFQSMHFRRLCKLFREQARSHGLRPESRADLCIVRCQRPARDSRM